jgi:hypothetical protein
MSGFTPRKVFANEVKAKLLRPALTSHFLCSFNPPPAVRNGRAGKHYMDNGETLSLLCTEASLPGSSIMTNEINDDRTGVTERFGYRRQYDDRSDFTFYVDYGRNNGNYNVILFFEEWMRYAIGETSQAPDANYHYRVNFPDGDTGYRTEMFVTKFERDFSGNALEYTFVRAFPISVTSMPVSYDSSQLLKCTVSFTYNRYVIDAKKIKEQSDSVSNLLNNIDSNGNYTSNPNNKTPTQDLIDYYNRPLPQYTNPDPTPTQQLIDRYNQPLNL